MDRRSFLGFLGVGALAAGPTLTGGAAARETWERAIENSGNYRLIKSLDKVNDLHIHREIDSAYYLTFYTYEGEWDFREWSLEVPSCDSEPAFRILGLAPYEVVFFPDTLPDGSSIAIVNFLSPTSVKVYAAIDQRKETVLLTRVLEKRV